MSYVAEGLVVKQAGDHYFEKWLLEVQKARASAPRAPQEVFHSTPDVLHNLPSPRLSCPAWPER